MNPILRQITERAIAAKNTEELAQYYEGSGRKSFAEILRSLESYAAEAAEQNERTLVRSSEARVELFQRGGRQEISWDRYSKKWHRSHGPSRWLNAGVRIVIEDDHPQIVVENYRGNVVATLNLPGDDVDCDLLPVAGSIDLLVAADRIEESGCSAAAAGIRAIC